MSADRVLYLDSSAIVKLVVREAESTALRSFLGGRGPLVSSALARTEVTRAVMPFGREAIDRAIEVLTRLDLVAVSDAVLSRAGAIQPPELRSLDAIHLATASLLDDDLAAVVCYDRRLSASAADRGWRVEAPR